MRRGLTLSEGVPNVLGWNYYTYIVQNIGCIQRKIIPSPCCGCVPAVTEIPAVASVPAVASFLSLLALLVLLMFLRLHASLSMLTPLLCLPSVGCVPAADCVHAVVEVPAAAGSIAAENALVVACPHGSLSAGGLCPHSH
jgi:hypothetical protein